jgi:hypothetical protein
VLGYGMTTVGSMVAVTLAGSFHVHHGAEVMPVHCPNPGWQPFARNGQFVVATHDVANCPNAGSGPAHACPAQSGPPVVWVVDTTTHTARRVVPRLTNVVGLSPDQIAGTVAHDGHPRTGPVVVVGVNGQHRHVVYHPKKDERVRSIVPAADHHALLLVVAGASRRVVHVNRSGAILGSTRLDIPAGGDVFVDPIGSVAVTSGGQSVLIDDLRHHSLRSIPVPRVAHDVPRGESEGGVAVWGVSSDGRYALVSRLKEHGEHTYYLLNTATDHLNRQPNLARVSEIVL